MVAGGMKLVKYLLFFFNFIFFISGIGLIVVGAVVQANVKDYVKILDSAFSTPPILCIVVGVLVTLIAFFGCCGAIKENYCMTMTFAVLLSLILILELAAGIAAYAMRSKIDEKLKDNTYKAIKKYDDKEYKDFTNAIDDIQTSFDCCGYAGIADWENSTEGVPQSCCKDGNRDAGCQKVDKNLNKDGCKDKIEKFFEKNIYYVGAVGIAFAIIQVLGVILSCCLASSIKKEYEVV